MKEELNIELVKSGYANGAAEGRPLTEEEKQLEKTKEPTFESVEDIRQDVEFLTNPNLPDQQTIYNKISKDELSFLANSLKIPVSFKTRSIVKLIL